MRFKLVLLTSLISALIGAAVSFISERALHRYWVRLVTPWSPSNVKIALLLTFMPIVLSALLAGIFVYRHTSRRRKTQAVLTTIVVLVLSILILYQINWLFPPPPILYG